MRGIVCQNELVFAHLMNHIFGYNSELNVWTIHLVPCSNLSHRHTRHTLSVPHIDWITISIDLHHSEITGLKTKCIVQWYLVLNCDRMSLRIVWVDRLGSGSSSLQEIAHMRLTTSFSSSAVITWPQVVASEFYPMNVRSYRTYPCLTWDISRSMRLCRWHIMCHL